MSNPIFELVGSDGTPIFIYKRRTVTCDEQDGFHHYDELKFVRVKSGAGVWQVGAKRYNVGAGDILLFSHADIRTIEAVYEPMDIVQFNFLPAAVQPRQACANCFYKRTADFENKLDRNSPFFAAVNICFDAILEEITAHRPYKREAILTHLTQMVIVAARLYPAEPETAAPAAGPIPAALDYIHTHLSDPLSLSDTAARAGLSPAYFSRLFKAHVGFSFQDYVARTRVARVIERLQNERVNVLDAALDAGFNSSSGFYRTFSAVTGSTPKAFLK